MTYVRKRTCIGAMSCWVLSKHFDSGYVDLCSLLATFILVYVDILGFKGVKGIKVTQIEVKVAIE